jgi:hypothetical protein
MKHSNRCTSWSPIVVLVSALLFCDKASAGSWLWACTGTLGEDRIVFNRDRLTVVAGTAPVGNLDDIIRGDLSADASHPGRAAIADYLPEDTNGGFVSTMIFSAAAGPGNLTLTEVSSKKIAHSGHLIAGCRDETVDRFRKSYRVQRDKSPSRTVTLVCMEYQLSTKGGRTCK